jgi:protein-ribulosamine 3-kinase
MLPVALRSAIEAALSARWHNHIALRDAQAVGGGCISNTSRLTTSTDEAVFLKWCKRGDLPEDIFAAESQALRALADTNTVRVPCIIAQSETTDQFDWLLLEWLEPARSTYKSWSKLGRALAELHRCTNPQFGWTNANYIGSLPQANAWCRDWPEFWRTQRLLPQLERATRHGMLSTAQRRRFDVLLNALRDLIATGNEDGPSLLHGDLWGGNVHGTADDIAVVIDPSIYYGHREVDLAMAVLFGGFDGTFYDAYEEAWKTAAGVEERRLVYQLYYLLVHINLFGSSYLASALSAVGQLGF